MPRIKHTTTPDEFDASHIKSRELNETNDCAVKAVSILTDEPYEKVLSLMAKHGRQARSGTHQHITVKVLEDLGFEVIRHREWDCYKHNGILRSMIDQYPSPHNNLKTATSHHPRRFPKVWAGFEDCLMGNSEHIWAFKDGEVKDWSINKSLRIREIIFIKKKGA